MIVGSLSDIVGLAMRILSINVGSRHAMLSVSRDYVFGPPHVGDDVIRIVSENANALRFDHASFERG